MRNQLLNHNAIQSDLWNKKPDCATHNPGKWLKGEPMYQGGPDIVSFLHYKNAEVLDKQMLNAIILIIQLVSLSTLIIQGNTAVSTYYGAEEGFTVTTVSSLSAPPHPPPHPGFAPSHPTLELLLPTTGLSSSYSQIPINHHTFMLF